MAKPKGFFPYSPETKQDLLLFPLLLIDFWHAESKPLFFGRTRYFQVDETKLLHKTSPISINKPYEDFNDAESCRPFRVTWLPLPQRVSTIKDCFKCTFQTASSSH
jgi:hypothetical protein